MTSESAIYPSQWERHLVIGDSWRIFVRPIKPDDEPLVHDMLQHVSKQDLRLRFFDSIKDFFHPFLASLTQLDYRFAMAFVAIDEDGSSDKILGVVRIHSDPIHGIGEYAVLLRSGLKGRGLGWALMRLIIEYAKADGLKQISGQVLSENTIMLKMCRELGFEIKTDPEDWGLKKVTLTLDAAPQTNLEKKNPVS